MVIPAYVDTVAIMVVTVRNKIHKIRSKDGPSVEMVGSE